jgi:hypothetical protein
MTLQIYLFRVVLVCAYHECFRSPDFTFSDLKLFYLAINAQLLTEFGMRGLKMFSCLYTLFG